MSGLTASDRRLDRDLARCVSRESTMERVLGGEQVEEEHGTFKTTMAPHKELHLVSHFPIHDSWCSIIAANQTASAVVYHWTSFARRIRPSRAVCSEVLTGTHDKSATTKSLLAGFRDRAVLVSA